MLVFSSCDSRMMSLIQSLCVLFVELLSALLADELIVVRLFDAGLRVLTGRLPGNAALSSGLHYQTRQRCRE